MFFYWPAGLDQTGPGCLVQGGEDLPHHGVGDASHPRPVAHRHHFQAPNQQHQ